MSAVTAFAYLPTRTPAGYPIQFQFVVEPTPETPPVVFVNWGDGGPVQQTNAIPQHTYTEGRREYVVSAWCEGQENNPCVGTARVY